MLPMVSPFIDSWLSRIVEKNKKLNLITYSCNHLKFDKDAKHTQWRKDSGFNGDEKRDAHIYKNRLFIHIYQLTEKSTPNFLIVKTVGYNHGQYHTRCKYRKGLSE